MNLSDALSILDGKNSGQAVQEGIQLLDIGCGKKKYPGAIGLDVTAFEGVDVVANLESRLPLENESFDYVFADQVLEHIRDLTSLMMEVHRVLRPGGYFLIHVPYFRSSWASIDPTHVRSFTINTLDYYVLGNWIREDYGMGEQAFSEIHKFLDRGYKASAVRALFRFFALRRPTRFENSTLSFVYPFQLLSFAIRK